MSVGKAVEWAIIAVVALIALRWLSGIFAGGLTPLADQQPGIGNWTNITPVTGPTVVYAGYGGGWWPGRRPGGYNGGGWPIRRGR
jgi:hypothetical protein